MAVQSSMGPAKLGRYSRFQIVVTRRPCRDVLWRMSLTVDVAGNRTLSKGNRPTSLLIRLVSPPFLPTSPHSAPDDVLAAPTALVPYAPRATPLGPYDRLTASRTNTRLAEPLLLMIIPAMFIPTSSCQESVM